MTELSLVIGLVAVIGAAVVVRRATGRGPVAFADEREERLTHRVASLVRASPAQVLPAVRHEIGLAPGQPDETLVKRAVYHYRQNLPERTCAIYPDRAPG